jgi:hypothetical protein
MWTMTVLTVLATKFSSRSYKNLLLQQHFFFPLQIDAVPDDVTEDVTQFDGMKFVILCYFSIYLL